jgi:hypothetical protein
LNASELDGLGDLPPSAAAVVSRIASTMMTSLKVFLPSEVTVARTRQKAIDLDQKRAGLLDMS